VLPPSGSAARPPAAAPGSGSTNDDAITAAVARGDHADALTLLMQQHGLEVHRFCCSMLGEPSLADDVHQAVFVQAYEGLGDFRRDGSWRGWLFGIARHRCLDAAKARKRWRWRFVLASDPGEPANAVPDAAVAPGEVDPTSPSDPRSVALADCLRRLAPHIRVAVLMRYEQGLSYEEIARVSRERAPALQARVARALPLLRDCVTSKEPQP
jgi:RNA polymerase sigma factor (sigma-70 family)